MFRLLAILATVARRRAARSPPLCIGVYLETAHRLSRSVPVGLGRRCVSHENGPPRCPYCLERLVTSFALTAF
jgi:hypothetical protein